MKYNYWVLAVIILVLSSCNSSVLTEAKLISYDYYTPPGVSFPCFCLMEFQVERFIDEKSQTNSIYLIAKDKSFSISLVMGSNFEICYKPESDYKETCLFFEHFPEDIKNNGLLKQYLFDRNIKFFELIRLEKL